MDPKCADLFGFQWRHPSLRLTNKAAVFIGVEMYGLGGQARAIKQVSLAVHQQHPHAIAVAE